MNENEKVILPSDAAFVYSGRIDFTEKEAPVLVFPCTSIRFVMSGKTGRIQIENRHVWNENSLGILVDGEHKGRLVLPDSGRVELDFSGYLDGAEHEITIFKRQDGCHYVTFFGLVVEKDAVVKRAAENPARRIEVYGDSVSAGEVSEAVDYVGKQDPEHNGQYSNSYYSYSWTCARKLHAEIHDIAQGGISLFDKEGYFAGPDYVGMLSCFDKIEYNPQLGEVKEWDFSQYIPHVVIIAIGQNDANPVNYMAEDYDGEHAAFWRAEYGRFVKMLRERYPHAHIILTTTILEHDPAWDRAIDEVAQHSGDEKVHHFLYSKNGCGTPGHIRIPEAEEMAQELSAFIDSLGEEVWNA